MSTFYDHFGISPLHGSTGFPSRADQSTGKVVVGCPGQLNCADKSNSLLNYICENPGIIYGAVTMAGGHGLGATVFLSKKQSSHDNPNPWNYLLIFTAVLVLFLPQLARAFCHQSEVAGHWPYEIIPAAAGPRTLTIQWLGHSAFYLTSSRGTKVLMDPHGGGSPTMDISPHVVTTSHFGGNHSNIWMASGNPIVLHGINMEDGNWIRLHKTIRDVSIFTVPTFHDSEMGMIRGKNTVFVVRMDGICVAHLGDLGHLLNETQVKMMGKIDVLLVPLGQGGYRIGTEDALKIVASVKPKTVIPYHYRWEGYAEEFAQNFSRVRNMEGNGVRLSKETLKAGPQVIVLTDLTQDLE